jgi:hypothetical protein
VKIQKKNALYAKITHFFNSPKTVFTFLTAFLLGIGCVVFLSRQGFFKKGAVYLFESKVNVVGLGNDFRIKFESLEEDSSLDQLVVNFDRALEFNYAKMLELLDHYNVLSNVSSQDTFIALEARDHLVWLQTQLESEKINLANFLEKKRQDSSDRSIVRDRKAELHYFRVLSRTIDKIENVIGRSHVVAS